MAQESTLPADSETVLARDAEIYFIDASFGYLSDEQLNHLFAAASRLIHADPEFQRLMSDLQRSP